MKNHRSGLVLAICLAVASTAFAQRNAEVDMVMPPVVTEPDLSQAVDDVKCSLAFTIGQGVIFGVSELKGTSDPVEFIVSSQLAPYNVFQVDEDCNLISSWTTSSSASSLTGCAYDTHTTTTYWLVQNSPIPKALVEYQLGTGTPTGRSFPIGNQGVPGPLCTNDNSSFPTDMAYEDLERDVIQIVDPISGQFGCSFANPDDTGRGAFGNGLDDAVDSSISNFVVSSGTLSEGQVLRAGEHGCAGDNPDTWNFINSILPLGATFPQGLAEFTSTAGEKCMMVADGSVNTLFVLRPGLGIANCQGVDSDDEKLVTVNLSSGGSDFAVIVNVEQSLTFRTKLPQAGGSGKFVAYWNAGSPDESTITNLPAQLGPICHPMLGVRPATEMAVFNNVGKTNRVGSSHYFGTPISDPPSAPTVVRQNPTGDPTNMPAGSCWTMQGIIFNPAATSPKGASVTNGIIVFVE